jgi:hypothetical protein
MTEQAFAFCKGKNGDELVLFYARLNTGFVTSYLPVRMELSSHWKDFHEIRVVFEYLSRKLDFN